jgi:dTDP-4-dehydrorhamnose reductase
MRIVVFGGSGQLGYELLQRAKALRFEMFAPVTSEVDIASREQVAHLLGHLRPDVVINSAAYTNVDLAEKESELAYRVNAEGPGIIARECAALGCRMFHVSTDYVFDGVFSRPIREDDNTNPLGVYGASKLAGEKAVTDALPMRSFVVRTSSLHGEKGQNFVHTMIKLFQEREKIQVVADQMMSPTWAGWLAEVLLDLCRIDPEGEFFSEPGKNILHASGAGAVSWYEFTCRIFELTRASLEKRIGKELNVEILPIPAIQFPRPAKRPMYSVLDGSRLERVLGRSRIGWEQGLKQHLAALELLV